MPTALRSPTQDYMDQIHEHIVNIIPGRWSAGCAREARIFRSITSDWDITHSSNPQTLSRHRPRSTSNFCLYVSRQTHEPHGTGVESAGLDEFQVLPERFERRHFVIALCMLGVHKYHKRLMRTYTTDLMATRSARKDVERLSL